jgi:hypothetical protein
MISEQHLSLGINMRGGYAQDSLRLEIPEAYKSEVNKDHRIWRKNENRWIKVVGQKSTSKKGHMAYHFSKDMQQTMSADHVSSLRQQGHVAQ